MQIDWEKYERAQDREVATKAILDRLKEDEDILRRNVVNTRYNLTRSLPRGLSSTTWRALGFNYPDESGLLSLIASDPQQVLDTIDPYSDSASHLVEQYLKAKREFDHLSNRIANAELDYHQALSVASKLRTYVHSVTGSVHRKF